MPSLAPLDHPCFNVDLFIAIVQTMDPLSDILTLLRPADYGFRGLDAAGDWALDFAPDQGIYCFAIEAGECWLSRARYDGRYQYQCRGTKHGKSVWLDRKPKDRFDHIIDTVFAIKSDHPSLLQVADAII